MPCVAAKSVVVHIRIGFFDRGLGLGKRKEEGGGRKKKKGGTDENENFSLENLKNYIAQV